MKPKDSRFGSRRRVLKAGIVAYNNRHCTLPCVVRDLSETGARLRMDGSLLAPDTFDLIIDLDGFEASCEVIWRLGSDLGVSFRGPARKVTPRRSQTITALGPSGPPSIRRKPSS